MTLAVSAIIAVAYASTALPPTATPLPTYEAEVVATNAFAMSGPGPGHYPTQTLRPGQVVTVTGQPIEGWLAILPTADSFSWIPAETVVENVDGTATISADKVQSRIGSLLSDAHHVHQVTLQKGDLISLVDEQTIAERDGPKRWFKILPPRGENRYVQASAVRVLETGEPLDRASDTPRIDFASRSTAPSQEGEILPIAARTGTRVIPPAQPISRPTGEVREAIPTSKPQSPATKFSWRDDPSKSVAERVQSLRDQVGVMRTHLPDQWDVEGLTRLVSDLKKAAKTDAEKKVVAELETLERATRGIHDRFVSTAKRREEFLKQDRELSQLVKRTLGAAGRPEARYDLEGVLKRSAMSLDGRLTYVLEDATGQTTHLVTFSPGITADKYLGRHVGIFGRVVRDGNGSQPRVIAEQVGLLD